MLPYVTRDVATDPPTTIVIVPSNGPPAELKNFDETVFAITEDCIEPTVGWLNREGRTTLTICFMHSFGKCGGRMNSDPKSCFQIHVKPVVLNALRRQYMNPARKYFIRTVKASLNQDLRQQLSQRAGKMLKVQYLEYRVQDVFPSAGLIQYEASYRHWLFSEEKTSDDSNVIFILQCTPFALTGFCENGSSCPYVHANLRNAQVRDPALAQVLRDFSSGQNGNEFRNNINSVNGNANLVPAAVEAMAPMNGFPVPVYTIIPSNSGFTLAPVSSKTMPWGVQKYTAESLEDASTETHKMKRSAMTTSSQEGGVSSNGGLSSNTKSGSSGSGSD